MNQNSRLPIDIAIVRHPGQKVLRLRFHRDALRDWCLGLCLLKEGLVEAFTVIEQGASGTKVKFLVEQRFSSKPRITFQAQSSEVRLTGNNLDYLRQFFLRYYRDGVAEVDHLDLEASDAETGDDEVYVTFEVSESRPPLSPEEAKRRLGDWS